MSEQVLRLDRWDRAEIRIITLNLEVAMKIWKCVLVVVGIGLLASTAGAASLGVETYAALNGTNYGLEITFDGTTAAAFVKDDTPAGETVYRAQFWFDVNTWDGIDSDWVFISRVTDETLWYAPYQVLMVIKSGLWRIWLRAQNNTAAHE